MSAVPITVGPSAYTQKRSGALPSGRTFTRNAVHAAT